MCKKRQFMFIAFLIPDAKDSKDNLDIYMQPLIDELLQLWNNEIMTYYVSIRQSFSLKVAFIWAVSDFPTYGMLFEWMIAVTLQNFAY